MTFNQLAGSSARYGVAWHLHMRLQNTWYFMKACAAVHYTCLTCMSCPADEQHILGLSLEEVSETALNLVHDGKERRMKVTLRPCILRQCMVLRENFSQGCRQARLPLLACTLVSENLLALWKAFKNFILPRRGSVWAARTLG
jgi:hypothetical protein